MLKKILITGAHSYIGTSVQAWLEKKPDKYRVETLDLHNPNWRSHDFSDYDVVFHVAGIAHRKETRKNAHQYYEVNRDLAIAVAKKAKREGVGQFVILSSMSVYGCTSGVISLNTKMKPVTHYGRSKAAADRAIQKLSDKNFAVAIIRPPMVYGNGCKGNYQKLAGLARKIPVFPEIHNERSMIYIDVLSAYVQNVINYHASGIMHPQNKAYVCTADLVRQIASANGKRIYFVKGFEKILKPLQKRKASVMNKVFGNLTYKHENDPCEVKVQPDFRETIIQTEKGRRG